MLNLSGKIGIGGIVITVALIIILISNTDIEIISDSNPTESPSESNYLKAIKLVQNFKGTDESGSTVTEAIVLIIRTAYGTEPIFDNPSTKFSWDGLRSFESSGNIYDVYADFKAYDGSKEFHFIVDMDTGTIFAGNELASNILKIVESEG